jgi:hypothetical protein
MVVLYPESWHEQCSTKLPIERYVFTKLFVDNGYQRLNHSLLQSLSIKVTRNEAVECRESWARVGILVASGPADVLDGAVCLSICLAGLDLVDPLPCRSQQLESNGVAVSKKHLWKIRSNTNVRIMYAFQKWWSATAFTTREGIVPCLSCNRSTICVRQGGH